MIILNDDQTKAKNNILSTINSPTNETDNKFHCLVGPAGTGKTTTFVEIIKAVPQNKSICLAAPTHKAVKVIRRMALEAGISDRVEIRTIHSCLGLKMTTEEDKEILVENPYAERTYYDMVFVDECSMLDEIIIMYMLQDKHTDKYIFVGDDYQVCPVNSESGEISPVFTEVDRRDDLTEIVRQAEGNPIIQLATDFRKAQDDHFSGWPKINQNITDEGYGVYVMPSWEWMNKLITEVKHGIEIGDGDHARAVAYTNDMVDTINDRVRKAIYGDDVEPYVEGEILVADGAMENKYANNEELRVLCAEDDIDDKYDLPCVLLKLVSLDTEMIIHVKVLLKEHEQAFQNKLSIMAEKAKVSKSLWRDFWELKKHFAMFKYSHCSTIHKSQGSTYNQTFFYSPDVFHRGASLEMKQLCYTAITRSRHKTIFAT